MHPPLLAHAAPVEARGLGDLPGASIVALGVGKAASAAAMTRALLERPPAWVLLFGVCGVYPAAHGNATELPVGALCLVGEDLLADEGVAAEDGFLSLASLGLGAVGPFPADPTRTSAAARVLAAPVVRGATVSTCSGTDAASQALARRSAAQVETMEGAAVAMVCAHHGVPLVQLRCVSNRTGDRARGGWDLHGAVATLQSAVRALAAQGWGGAP